MLRGHVVARLSVSLGDRHTVIRFGLTQSARFVVEEERSREDAATVKAELAPTQRPLAGRVARSVV